MILVVGSTGLVGHDICLRLRARGEQVRALVRSTSNPEKVSSLHAAGAQIATGDLKDGASLAAACDGADAIVSTASCTMSRQPGDCIQTVDDEGQLRLVEAARSAGITRFVFISFRRPSDISVPLATAKQHVENAIADLNHTVLRASFFMESWLSPALGFDYLNRTVRMFGSGEAPISWVAAADVAEMCAIAVRHPAAERATIDFGGPEPLSPLQVVSLFEKVSGKPFQRQHIPLEAALQQFHSASDPLERSFAALGLAYAHGDAMHMSETQRRFGLKLTTVEDYSRRVLAA